MDKQVAMKTTIAVYRRVMDRSAQRARLAWLSSHARNWLVVMPVVSNVPWWAIPARTRARSTTRAIRINAEATSEADPRSSNAGVIIAAIVATAAVCEAEFPMRDDSPELVQLPFR
jgi:hypothetical protein